MNKVLKKGDFHHVLAADCYACGMYDLAAFFALAAAALEFTPIVESGRKVRLSRLADEDTLRTLRAVNVLRIVVEALHRNRKKLGPDEKSGFDQLKNDILEASIAFGSDAKLLIGKVSESLKTIAIDLHETERAAALQEFPRDIDTPFDAVGVKCGEFFMHLAADVRIDPGDLRELATAASQLSAPGSTAWSSATKMHAHYEFFRLIYDGRPTDAVDEAGYLRVLNLYDQCPEEGWGIEWIGRVFLSLAFAYLRAAKKQPLKSSQYRTNADFILHELHSVNMLSSTVYTEGHWQQYEYEFSFAEQILRNAQGGSIRHRDLNMSLEKWRGRVDNLRRQCLRQLLALSEIRRAEDAIALVTQRRLSLPVGELWPATGLLQKIEHSWTRELSVVLGKKLVLEYARKFAPDMVGWLMKKAGWGK